VSSHPRRFTERQQNAGVLAIALWFLGVVGQAQRCAAVPPWGPDLCEMNYLMTSAFSRRLT
jgi:hypothetical protein